MESEGLYRYEHRDEQKAFVVVGPGRENMGGTYTKNEASIAARLANLAYAEGRKSMEKDFRELLELADRLKFSGSYFPDGLEDEFDAWKKARGIS